MLLVRFLFYKIYNFYNRFWPNNDPELYAYLAVSFMVSLNIYSLHFVWLLSTNPDADVNVYIGLFILSIVLIICYFEIMRNGIYRQMSAESFRLKGVVSNITTLAYILLTFIMVLMLAYWVRQHHITDNALQ